MDRCWGQVGQGSAPLRPLLGSVATMHVHLTCNVPLVLAQQARWLCGVFQRGTCVWSVPELFEAGLHMAAQSRYLHPGSLHCTNISKDLHQHL